VIAVHLLIEEAIDYAARNVKGKMAMHEECREDMIRWYNT
jgi:hypothetical protein